MPIKTIPIAEARRLTELGRPLHIVDVRTPAEFDAVHASGARSIPLDELDPAALAADRRSADDPIYVICQSGTRAAQACRRLDEAGVANVFNIEGGTAAWTRAGLPVERGASRVISLERQVRIAAGSLVLVGAVLAWVVNPAFAAVPALVGAGLVFAGVTDRCGMAFLLARLPWNRPAGPASTGSPPARPTR